MLNIDKNLKTCFIYIILPFGLTVTILCAYKTIGKCCFNVREI